MQIHIAMLLLIAGVITGCAASPYSSPEAMVAYQRKRAPYLAKLYPPGTPRETLLAKYPKRGAAESSELIWYQETYSLPVSLPIRSQSTWAPRKVEAQLPHAIAAAEEMCPTRPVRVDVFEVAVGSMGIGTDGDYVFYDNNDRVMTTISLIWDR